MPIIVEPSYHISLDEKATWVVRPDMLSRAEDHTFVRLRTWDKNLISIITSIAGVDLPTKCRPSLAGCPGYQALKSLRNTTLSATDDDATAANALFGDSAAVTLKAPRISLATMADLRNNRQVMEMQIQVSGRAPLNVLALKPGHSNEDVAVHLEPDTLEYVFAHIAEQGVTVEDLLAKRQYGTDHGPGVWSNGSAGLVLRIGVLADHDESDESERKATKFQSLSTKTKQASLSDIFARPSQGATDKQV